MKGTSDIAFDPNVNTTIGMSVTVLYNMTDNPTSKQMTLLGTQRAEQGQWKTVSSIEK